MRKIVVYVFRRDKNGLPCVVRLTPKQRKGPQPRQLRPFRQPYRSDQLRPTLRSVYEHTIPDLSCATSISLNVGGYGIP